MRCWKGQQLHRAARPIVKRESDRKCIWYCLNTCTWTSLPYEHRSSPAEWGFSPWRRRDVRRLVKITSVTPPAAYPCGIKKREPRGEGATLRVRGQADNRDIDRSCTVVTVQGQGFNAIAGCVGSCFGPHVLFRGAEGVIWRPSLRGICGTSAVTPRQHGKDKTHISPLFMRARHGFETPI
jgi:hypothetical protein